MVESTPGQTPVTPESAAQAAQPVSPAVTPEAAAIAAREAAAIAARAAMPAVPTAQQARAALGYGPGVADVRPRLSVTDVNKFFKCNLNLLPFKRSVRTFADIIGDEQTSVEAEKETQEVAATQEEITPLFTSALKNPSIVTDAVKKSIGDMLDKAYNSAFLLGDAIATTFSLYPDDDELLFSLIRTVIENADRAAAFLTDISELKKATFEEVKVPDLPVDVPPGPADSQSARVLTNELLSLNINVNKTRDFDKFTPEALRREASRILDALQYQTGVLGDIERRTVEKKEELDGISPVVYDLLIFGIGLVREKIDESIKRLQDLLEHPPTKPQTIEKLKAASADADRRWNLPEGSTDLTILQNLMMRPEGVKPEDLALTFFFADTVKDPPDPDERLSFLEESGIVKQLVGQGDLLVGSGVFTNYNPQFKVGEGGILFRVAPDEPEEVRRQNLAVEVRERTRQMNDSGNLAQSAKFNDIEMKFRSLAVRSERLSIEIDTDKVELPEAEIRAEQQLEELNLILEEFSKMLQKPVPPEPVPVPDVEKAFKELIDVSLDEFTFKLTSEKTDETYMMTVNFPPEDEISIDFINDALGTAATEVEGMFSGVTVQTKTEFTLEVPGQVSKWPPTDEQLAKITELISEGNFIVDDAGDPLTIEDVEAQILSGDIDNIVAEQMIVNGRIAKNIAFKRKQGITVDSLDDIPDGVDPAKVEEWKKNFQEFADTALKGVGIKGLPSIPR